MKKVLITALAVMAALSTYAQGTMNFQVLNTAYNVKYDNDNNASTAAIAVPTATVAGAANKFQVALFYATAGTTDASQFTQVGAATDITLANGIFMGGTRTLPVPGGTYSFQIRGWGLGANSQYTGSSAIWTQATGDPNGAPPTSPAAIVLGASGFGGLTLVPEPSTIALGILGLAGLFVLRRRS
jgi:hypothetical protein